MTLATRLYTWFRGELVGTDQFVNRYYRDRTGASRCDGLREKRWVMFNGEAEASRVPPDWHAWLHHTVVAPPLPGAQPAKPWQREHVPNLTGTALAYRPPGHEFKGGKRAAASGDYEPWTPS